MQYFTKSDEGPCGAWRCQFTSKMHTWDSISCQTRTVERSLGVGNYPGILNDSQCRVTRVLARWSGPNRAAKKSSGSLL